MMLMVSRAASGGFEANVTAKASVAAPQFLFGTSFPNEAGGLRPVGVQPLNGDREASCAFGADSVPERSRPAARDRDAEVHLEEAELTALARDLEVTVQCDNEAASTRLAAS